MSEGHESEVRSQDSEVGTAEIHHVAKRGRGRPPNILQIVGDKPIQERVKVIREYHQAAYACVAQGAMYAILTGFELIAARAQIGHGYWKSWVAQNCPFTYRTACNYMEAAQRKYPQIPKVQHVSSFALGVAPHLLPPAQREELIEAVRYATDGESVRQLYLDLGLIKPPPDYSRLGGDHGGGLARAALLKSPEYQEELKRRAEYEFTRCISELRVFVLKKHQHELLDPATLRNGVLALREAMAPLEALKKKTSGDR